MNIPVEKFLLLLLLFFLFFSLSLSTGKVLENMFFCYAKWHIYTPSPFSLECRWVFKGVRYFSPLLLYTLFAFYLSWCYLMFILLIVVVLNRHCCFEYTYTHSFLFISFARMNWLSHFQNCISFLVGLRTIQFEHWT